jgi:hypothetical protein
MQACMARRPDARRLDDRGWTRRTPPRYIPPAMAKRVEWYYHRNG